MPHETQRKWSLEEVQEHFSAWRVKRPRPKRIPDELWQEALSLLPQYTINKVAKALRLENSSLKKKAAAAGVKVVSRKSRKALPPTFLETNLEEIVVSGAPSSPLPEWQVLIKRTDGMEMTITGNHLSEAALAGLVGSFSGGQ